MAMRVSGINDGFKPSDRVNSLTIDALDKIYIY